MKWQVDCLQIVKTPVGAMLMVPAGVEVLNQIQENKRYNIELKLHREKRSLTANSYCWVLCQKIAEELSKNGVYTSREDVYRQAIKGCQAFTPMPIKAEAVERFTEIWQSNGIGWIVEDVGNSKLNGYKVIHAYYGSSTYDTKEMARLIDCLVSEATALGIETKTEEEVNSLLEEWKGIDEQKQSG